MAPRSNKPGSALLILTKPPSVSDFAVLKAAYGPALERTLCEVAKSTTGSPDRRVLDIGVALPQSQPKRSAPKALIYHPLQKLLASVYKLICIVSAQQSIDLNGLGSIDVRVFFIQEPAQRQDYDQDLVSGQLPQGPVIDMQTLASSRRNYDRLFVVESEEGEKLDQDFLQNFPMRPYGSTRRPVVIRVPGGLRVNLRGSVPNTGTDSSGQIPERHYSVAVGGTFDHLHAGHKLLLSAVALVVEDEKGAHDEPRKLTIGITGDELLTKKKFAEAMESWDDRQQSTANFLESILIFSPSDRENRRVENISAPGPNGRLVRASFGSDLVIDYVQISDPFGPTITDESISALVISAETRAGGGAVNDERAKKGWAALVIFEVDVLDTQEREDDQMSSSEENFQSKISSTEIRRQRIEQAQGKME